MMQFCTYALSFFMETSYSCSSSSLADDGPYALATYFTETAKAVTWERGTLACDKTPLDYSIQVFRKELLIKVCFLLQISETFVCIRLS